MTDEIQIPKEKLLLQLFIQLAQIKELITSFDGMLGELLQDD